MQQPNQMNSTTQQMQYQHQDQQQVQVIGMKLNCKAPKFVYVNSEKDKHF